MNEELLFEDSIDINKMFELHYIFSNILEKEIKNEIFNELPEENDYGFIEYKRNFLSYENKLTKLKTQIYWRLSQGLTYNSQSSCYYLLGLENNGKILNPISEFELSKSIEILNNSLKNSNIKYIHKKVIYKDKYLILFKFWKEEFFKNSEISIILLGASESLKTNFFIDLHNSKFNIDKYTNNKLFKSNTFDIHSNETNSQRTLTLHHQYLNIGNGILENNNFIEISNDEGSNIHIIDTPGNSIISNIKYVISYNVDIILHFNQNNDLYVNILNKINERYNNVLNITDTNYLNDFNIKKVIQKILLKYNSRNKILESINNIILINENRLLQSYQNSNFNKYISFCYNLMNVNIFDNISDINIRNIQYKYNYKSSIISNNSISIETDKPIYKNILGDTNILEIIELPEISLDENENVITFYIIILNQIFLVNGKNIPNKIIFDKIILIPEKFKSIPIFIIWSKNNKYYLEIYDLKKLHYNT